MPVVLVRDSADVMPIVSTCFYMFLHVSTEKISMLEVPFGSIHQTSNRQSKKKAAKLDTRATSMDSKFGS